MKKLSKKLRARRSLIVNELSRMSRDWSKYKAVDWQPLERELAEIDGSRIGME